MKTQFVKLAFDLLSILGQIMNMYFAHLINIFSIIHEICFPHVLMHNNVVGHVARPQRDCHLNQADFSVQHAAQQRPRAN